MGVLVRQKVKGKGKPWWVLIRHNGTYRCKKIGDRRAAEAVASELRRKLKVGELNLDDARSGNKLPLFADYAKHHLEDYAKTTCKLNTWRRYEDILKLHLLPAWRNRRLNEITRADIKQLLLQKLQEGFAPATVANFRTLISSILTLAYEEEIVASNPAWKMGKFIPKQDARRNIRFLTRGQVTSFLRTVRRHFPEHYALFLCAFRTGMRLGEVHGLAWEDADFTTKTITVRRSCSNGHFTTPKSHKIRVVDMSDQLARVLQQHRKLLLQRFRGKQPRWEVPDVRGRDVVIEPMFPSRKGCPLDGNNFRRKVFAVLLEKTDVPRFRFHDIRHTFASLLLSQGESLHYVKEQMGHSSIQTTVDIYGHLVPGANRNAVNKLDNPDEEFTLRLMRGGKQAG